MRLLVIKIALLSIVFCAVNTSFAQPLYTVTKLDPLPSDVSNRAYGINNSKQIVGSSSGNAFLWENGVTKSLGTQGEALDINDLGQVVGKMWVGGDYYPFYWENNNLIQLQTPEFWGIATAINNNGTIAGYGYSGALSWEGPSSNPFIITGIGKAYGINNNDDIVGDVTVTGGTSGFIYNDNELSYLNSLGGSHGRAFDVNESGIIVGDSNDANGYQFATMWVNGLPQNLGSFDGRQSLAYAVNNSDQIVGWGNTDQYEYGGAFLWENGNFYDLNDLIDDSLGWELYSAEDINDLGQIVGYGKFNGEIHAFLMTPIPEDTDGDGIPDDEDACPDSDLSDPVVIDGCDSGVENVLLEDGCTISDLILECAEDADNHGEFVSSVSHTTNSLKKEGIISGKDKGRIQKCAGKADIP